MLITISNCLDDEDLSKFHKAEYRFIIYFKGTKIAKNFEIYYKDDKPADFVFAWFQDEFVNRYSI